MRHTQSLIVLELIHTLAVIVNVEGQTLQNIALRKSATQDEHDTSRGVWPASNAVDGNSYNCGTINRNTVTLSGYSNNPWWQVDLGDLYNIERVEVYGRADGHTPEQLQGFRLILSTFQLTNTTNFRPVYIGTSNQNIYRIPNLHTTARFCRLEVPPGHRTNQFGPIVLCEVKIFGTVLENVALRKSATQDENANNDGIWPASNAVDGNSNNCGTIDSNTLTLSGYSNNPWWQVDLGDLCNIEMVEVYGRSDGNNPEQLQGFRLILSTLQLTHTTNVRPVYIGTSNQSIYRIPNLHTTARFCRLEVPPGHRTDGYIGPIVLCEVKIFGTMLENVALRKSATQDEYDNSRGVWPASNAVDGNSNNCGTINSNTLTLSDYSNNPWWQVDLGDLYNIKRVEVYGRADGHNPEQLQGFRLFLSTVPLTNTADVQPVYIGTDTQTIYRIPNLHTIARFCRLEVPPGHRLQGQDRPIVLCEVKIFGTALSTTTATTTLLSTLKTTTTPRPTTPTAINPTTTTPTTTTQTTTTTTTTTTSRLTTTNPTTTTTTATTTHTATPTTTPTTTKPTTTPNTTRLPTTPTLTTHTATPTTPTTTKDTATPTTKPTTTPKTTRLTTTNPTTTTTTTQTTTKPTTTTTTTTTTSPNREWTSWYQYAACTLASCHTGYESRIRECCTTGNNMKCIVGLPWDQLTPLVGKCPGQCHVCYGPPDFCEHMHGPTSCAAPNNYCINRLVNREDGTRTVNRTCGNIDICYREWWIESSDNDKCTTFDQSQIITYAFTCTFCCVSDNCNEQIRPDSSTLYTTNVIG